MSVPLAQWSVTSLLNVKTAQQNSIDFTEKSRADLHAHQCSVCKQVDKYPKEMQDEELGLEETFFLTVKGNTFVAEDVKYKRIWKGS